MGKFAQRTKNPRVFRPGSVNTWIQEMRGPRAVRRYEIYKHGHEELLVTAEALWVWVDPAATRPRAIPPELVNAFELHPQQDT